MAKTNRDVTMNYAGATVTIPKGTAVKLVKNASGTEGDLWAVSSIKFLIDLTGNAHDPKYRYAFIKSDDVDT